MKEYKQLDDRCRCAYCGAITGHYHAWCRKCGRKYESNKDKVMCDQCCQAWQDYFNL